MAGGHYPCCCDVARGSSALQGSSRFRGIDVPSSGTVQCLCCPGLIAPAQLQVNVPTLIKGPATRPECMCDACGELTGGYIVDYLAFGDGPRFSWGGWEVRWTCAWGLRFPRVCAFEWAFFGIFCKVPGSVTFEFWLMLANEFAGMCSGEIRWEQSLPTENVGSCFFDGFELGYTGLALSTQDCVPEEFGGSVFVYSA